MSIGMKNLPPVVDTYQTAFVNTEGVRVYFSPSVLYQPTTTATITPRRVHYTVKKQNNNENAFSSTMVTYGIDILDYDGYYYGYDTDKRLYYIYIPNYLIGGDGFLINTYYKVQIRFDNCTDTITDKSAYLSTNTDYFTEWSTITLLKPISRPRIVFSALGETLGTFPIVGKLKFQDTAETEKLKEYQIFVYAGTDVSKDPIHKSEVLTPGNINNPNEINYNFYLNTTADQITIIVEYETTNGYTGKKITYQTIQEQYELKGTITVDKNDDNGIINLTISSDNQDWSNCILYVRRASSLDNYTNWEMFYTENIESGNENYGKVLLDKTVQSLTGYKYNIQLYNPNGDKYYSTIKESDEIIPQFDTCLITDGDIQLALRYNYKISSLKPTSNITKIDTLGGKYPKFAENPVTKYKTISLTAMISAEADFDQMFYKIDNSDESFYKKYKTACGIVELVRNEAENDDWSEDDSMLKYPHEDPLLEREFREKVCSWINTSTPKLLRSINEGNMMIVFTEPTFTPQESLGGRIFNLTMTGYEVGKGTTIEELKSFGIIDTGETGSEPEPGPGPVVSYSVQPFAEYSTTELSDDNVKYYSNVTIMSETENAVVNIQRCSKNGITIGDAISITLDVLTDTEKYIYHVGDGIFIKSITRPDGSSILFDVFGVKCTNQSSSTTSTTQTTQTIIVDEYQELGQYAVTKDYSLASNIINTAKWTDNGYTYTTTVNKYYGVNIIGPAKTEITITYVNNNSKEVEQNVAIPDSGILNLSSAEIVMNSEGIGELEEYDYGIKNITTSSSSSLIINYVANMITTKVENSGDSNAS